MAIMRSQPIELPPHLIKSAQLYAPGQSPTDAVCHVLEDYPLRVAELRQLRSRVQQLDQESADFDSRLEALHAACSAIIDLCE